LSALSGGSDVHRVRKMVLTVTAVSLELFFSSYYKLTSIENAVHRAHCTVYTVFKMILRSCILHFECACLFGV